MTEVITPQGKKFEYINANRDEMNFYCCKAIDAKLFVSGWDLYENYLCNEKIAKMIIVKCGEEFVGCGVLLPDCFEDYCYEFQVYVKISYRRLGIGSSILKKFYSENTNIVVHRHDQRSEKFFNSFDFSLRNHYLCMPSKKTELSY